jgi:hypothetical protein
MAHIAFKIAQYSKESYKPFTFFNIPWWVPLEFFLAGFFLLLTYPIRKKIFKLSQSPRRIGDALISFGFSLSLYLLTSFLPEEFFIIKNLILFLILFFHVRWMNLSGINVWLELFWIGLNGCSFEFVLGQLGIFQYNPSPSLIFTIPIWLWFLYMSVAVTIRTAYEALHSH